VRLVDSPRDTRRACGRLTGRAARIEPSLTFLEPRKRPRQARARATYAAIVDACAQLLAVDSYEALTTNGVAERAGVSIGTLYEYFPNRESIVATLAADACHRLVARMHRAAEESVGMGDFQGVEHLIRAGIAAMAAPENAFRTLVHETPFVLRLPAFREARLTLDALCQGIRVGAGPRINLPEPQADAWLISQMLFSAMLEIAVLETGPAQRVLLTRELARLTFRMAVGREASAVEMADPLTPRRLS
jgi:AcrR family transcriptional regulator